ATQLVLPVDDILRIKAPMISGWLAVLNGPRAREVELNPVQREALLTLVCGYRAFLELPRGVEPAHFEVLAAQLMVAATDLKELDDGLPHLREIAKWLQETLP
ncbi:hypothetical protein C8Q76DRAFT_569810, partial [Earliella scabrosa]